MSNVLVMVQTNNNQSFIFSSPRLREQIGASFEITLLSRWVKEEAEKLLKQKPLPTSFWVSDSSGKVIVRFTNDEGAPKNLAKQLIREVTLRALTDAPGLDVTGVFIEATFDKVDARDLNKLDRVFLEYSLNRRPAAARFPQFPFLERGSESALPASASLGTLKFSQESLQRNNFDESSPLSLPSRVKRAFASRSRKQQVDDVKERLAKQGKELKQEPPLDPTKLAAAFQDGEEFEDAKNMLSSVGVVHIDGNGVGAIMRDLGCAHRAVQKVGVSTISDEETTEESKGLQSFIMEVNRRLDNVVKDAIALSWYYVQELTPDTVVPIVPVLVGGDDVTVYTDGRYAISFAEAYIHHYEKLTKDDDLLSVLAIVAGGKKADAPERDQFEIDDYIIQNPGPLTASAGVAIVGRNFPFHIAYDLAEGLVKRGKKLGKKKGEVPCSTIDFHVLRDATVLDPDETLDEYKGRVQRPFLVGCYAPDRIGDAPTTSSEEAPTAESQPLPSWEHILRAVAVFDGKKPDDPTQTTGDPFPRAHANRIVKLLAEGKEDQAATEWGDALQNATGAGRLAKQLEHLPPHPSDSAGTGDSLEQIKWLLDLIDLSGNLPDGYLACRIGQGNDDGSAATTDDPTEGDAK